MLHLPETTVFTPFLCLNVTLLMLSLQCHTLKLNFTVVPPRPLSLSVFVCVSHSSSALVGLFLLHGSVSPSAVQTEVCESSVWEPDRVRVREWAGPAQCRGFLYDDVRREEPSPYLSLLCLLPLPLLISSPVHGRGCY